MGVEHIGDAGEGGYGEGRGRVGGVGYYGAVEEGASEGQRGVGEGGEIGVGKGVRWKRKGEAANLM